MADKTSPILTEEEAYEAVKPYRAIMGVGAHDVWESEWAIARAQLKHLYEWGNEPCPHDIHHSMGRNKKHECLECWQLLLEKEG